ncbi:MAG TPA: cytochrome P460 family protein, partial [Thermoanaerobaculia bacterium]|nr:cytochrome P460 family protein [Thermoanaerobaculia bacterium]
MGFRRALASLMVPVAVAAVVTAVPSAPVSQAAEAVPEICSARLPLPSEFPFAKSEYERILGRFLKEECYVRLGWHHDKELRPTGPTVAALGGDPHNPSWTTTTWGTHSTVVVYYSPDVYRYLCESDAAGEKEFVEECEKTCPECRLDGAAPVRPIADGSMILKLMYGNTTAEELENPSIPEATNMIALMVRDGSVSKDGWFWGSWDPQATEESQLDWPPPVNLPYPWMGAGYYCVNCHASAREEFTFSSLNNILGDPDTFLKFYFQDQPPVVGAPEQPTVETPSVHERFQPLQDLLQKSGSAPAWNEVPWPNPQVQRVSSPNSDYSADFLKTFGTRRLTPPDARGITKLYMPPEVYDHVISGPDGAPLFLTSDQCVGCHAAGSTGMHFDMTLQQAGQPAYKNLLNLAPYGEWRGSPMGLAGRDPVFFSQLETEETVHPALGKLVQDLCLHCHGVMGQRQLCLDQFKDDPKRGNEVCNNTDLLGLDENSQPIVKRELFSRAMVNAIPHGAKTEKEKRDSKYGALARDGVSCTTCHHIEIDEKTPIGHTFTGDFRVGAADVIHGPFAGPQQVPMEHSLGAKPVEYAKIQSSKVCGSCHSVVLPVFDGNKPWVRPGEKKPEVIIEQATYPEWVFSDFRDGGATPRSCQSCHMATTYPGFPETLASKIASIQEASNMPQAENRRPESEIDLQTRSPFARHTLVGLNVFFNLFAQQFPDILGIRIQDPMLGGKGVAPLKTTYDSMIQQADAATATVSVTGLRLNRSDLVADVQVENLAGHKLPSGVGFRRAFLTFEVLDASGNPIWVSGRAAPT